MEDSPEGEDSGRRGGGDTVAPCAVDRNSDVAVREVLVPGGEAKSAVGPEYMRSIVGRSARPKSVERKSDGRSESVSQNEQESWQTLEYSCL